MDDRPITLTEDNDETLLLTVVPEPADSGEDLTTITELRLVMKEDRCSPDAAALLTLASTNPAQILIGAQTATQILAHAFVPRSALQGAWPRFYRVDGYVGTQKRTAMAGVVTVNNV